MAPVRKDHPGAKAVGPNKKPRTLEQYFPHQVSVHTTTNDVHSVTHVLLNEEQARVLELCRNGSNIFFTGSAGTGKSLLLGAIIRALRRKHTKEPGAVAVTASTGMAASNIGGITLHAWGAISPNCHDLDTVLKRIRHNKTALQRWRLARVLVIDEISMIDSRLFELTSDIAQKLRRSTEPFGGLQVIITGDFLQLPPVTRRGETPSFAFESFAWRHTIQHSFNLRQVFRQKDHTFIDALESLRVGSPSPEAVKLFQSLSRPLVPLQICSDSGSDSNTQRQTTIFPTQLFPLRKDVAKANLDRLNALPSQEYRYMATDSGPNRELLEGGVLAESHLLLKFGAQVMLIKNVDDVLVNGLVGNIIGLYRSWEVTTNVADLDTNSLNKTGPYIRDVQLHAGRAILTATAPPGSAGQDNARYPLVLFHYNIKGIKSEEESCVEAILIKRDEFRIDDPEGKLLARRVQIPLLLAWAVSIHKSQGQTIDRIKVDLHRVFEKGMTYVALSRASSLDGLEVIGFDSKKVQAHLKVTEWAKSLEDAGSIHR